MSGPLKPVVPFNWLHQVRVAVVQLECHPAFTIGHSDYLSEPFYSDKLRCLESLANHGFQEAKELQRTCRERYLKWAEVRLKGVLRWFTRRFPEADVGGGSKVQRRGEDRAAD